jgi:hypothetical protein
MTNGRRIPITATGFPYPFTRRLCYALSRPSLYFGHDFLPVSNPLLFPSGMHTVPTALGLLFRRRPDDLQRPNRRSHSGLWGTPRGDQRNPFWPHDPGWGHGPVHDHPVKGGGASMPPAIPKCFIPPGTVPGKAHCVKRRHRNNSSLPNGLCVRLGHPERRRRAVKGVRALKDLGWS